MGSSQRVIAVLGMHRSGTSCLAGTLMECGVHFGNVSRSNPYNTKGNNENLKIMALHEDLLRDNSGSWHAPPEVVRWGQKHRCSRDDILHEYESVSGGWGFKDPRTLFCLDGWQEAIPDLCLVGVFRHPDAVVQSLSRRNAGLFTPHSAAELWYRYNRRLLSYVQAGNVALIEFDSVDRRFVNQLQRLTGDLNLDKPTQGFAFFESKLRHCQPRTETPYPNHVWRIYEELKRRSRFDSNRAPQSVSNRSAA